MKPTQSFLRSLFDAAVKAADPMACVPAHLPKKPSGRVVVIGAGKASARMAEAVESVWGTCEGLVITRYGYERPLKGIDLRSASHPVPDDAGVKATRDLLDLVKNLGEDDFVLSLISGGGSALLCAPETGISLEEKRQLTEALLKSGAPIAEINGVRKTISRVKGGRLAAEAYPARMLSLMISDVPGDDPSDIASGPTVGSTSDTDQAARVLQEWGVTPATSIAAFLRTGGNPVLPGDERLDHVENRVVAAPSQSLSAAANLAKSAGIDVEELGDSIEGEAADLAKDHVQIALTRQKSLRRPLLLLSGGECTVTHRGVGTGGPNAEYVLSAGVALKGAPGIHVLACDTDGVDGAAEVAGAVIGPETLIGHENAAELALETHDSHGFFGKIGAQVITGPTLTNVNDFRAILIEPL